MNLKLIADEISQASADDLSQTLRLIADRLTVLHDTVIIDRNGRAVISDVRQRINALVTVLHDLIVRQQAALLGDRKP
jgi:hypothetical protein